MKKIYKTEARSSKENWKNKEQLQYKNKVKEKLNKKYNIRRNHPLHKGNHFSNFYE